MPLAFNGLKRTGRRGVKGILVKLDLTWRLGDRTARTRGPVIDEEPLSIRIQGNPYSIIMRTPGEEIFHTAGFCLGEGIVDTPDDFASIGFCKDQDANGVTVTLTSSRRRRVQNLLERRGFISQTSCGICGKEQVSDLFQWMRPVQKEARMRLETALTRLFSLSGLQPLRKITHASHAAALFGKGDQPLAVAEDVGRHNALDKAVGKLFLQKKLGLAETVILSSRISYELVQKTARAGIPIILAVSRPTSLAVELALSLNITLGCLSEDDGLYLYTHAQRIL